MFRFGIQLFRIQASLGTLLFSLVISFSLSAQAVGERTCGSGIIDALKLGTDLSALVRLAPVASTPESETEGPDSPTQAMVKQLNRVVEPLRAGGALAEILQSPFFHETLSVQASEQGWAGHQRFSYFFKALPSPTQVHLLRALTVRLWLYTFREPHQFRGGVRAEELLRYRSLLESFMATGTDKIVHHFMARLEFETDETDAAIYRVISIPHPYFESEPFISFGPDSRFAAYEETGTALLKLQPTGKHYPFAYWMALNRACCSTATDRFGVGTFVGSGLLSPENNELQSGFSLPIVDSDYLSKLDYSVLVLRVTNLRWRLAMSRVTNPAQEIGLLRHRINETVRTSAGGSSAQTRVLTGLLHAALTYLGLGWLNYSIQPETIGEYTGYAQAFLPEQLTETLNTLSETLNGLEAQLTDWVGQMNAIGNSAELEAELNKLQLRLLPTDLDPPAHP